MAFKTRTWLSPRVDKPMCENSSLQVDPHLQVDGGARPNFASTPLLISRSLSTVNILSRLGIVREMGGAPPFRRARRFATELGLKLADLPRRFEVTRAASF